MLEKNGAVLQGCAENRGHKRLFCMAPHIATCNKQLVGEEK